MNWEIWVPFLIAIAAWIPKLWEIVGNRNKTKAETKLIASEEGENISKAAETAVNVLLQALTFNQSENKNYQARVVALEENQDRNTKLIKELTSHRDERDAQLASLQAQITKDVEETQRLRNDYAVAQKQIVRLEELVIGAGDYIETMKSAMIKANIPLPLNGELLESVMRLKVERAQRGKK